MRLILSHDEVPKQEVMPQICWTTLCYTKANDQHFDSKDLYGSIPSPLPANLNFSEKQSIDMHEPWSCCILICQLTFPETENMFIDQQTTYSR